MSFLDLTYLTWLSFSHSLFELISISVSLVPLFFRSLSISGSPFPSQFVPLFASAARSIDLFHVCSFLLYRSPSFQLQVLSSEPIQELFGSLRAIPSQFYPIFLFPGHLSPCYAGFLI